MNFFITGIPRSRTAWLAAFLSQDRLCFHEGFNGCYSLDAYKKKLGENNGDSNTGLVYIDVNKEFPGCPVLCIHGDIERSAKYMYDTFGIYDMDFVKELEMRVSDIKGMHINLNEVNDKLPEIWEYLIGNGYNEQRAEIFKKLNIQILDPHDFDKDAIVSLVSEMNNVPKIKSINRH